MNSLEQVRDLVRTWKCMRDLRHPSSPISQVIVAFLLQSHRDAIISQEVNDAVEKLVKTNTYPQHCNVPLENFDSFRQVFFRNQSPDQRGKLIPKQRNSFGRKEQ